MEDKLEDLLARLPKEPTLKEMRCIISVLDQARVGVPVEVGIGFTLQKISDDTVRFIQADDNIVVAHIVSLFVKAGELLGCTVETDPYLILTPSHSENENRLEVVSDDNEGYQDNMFG